MISTIYKSIVHNNLLHSLKSTQAFNSLLSTFPSGQPHAPPGDAHITVALGSLHVAVGTQPEKKIFPSAGHVTTGK